MSILVGVAGGTGAGKSTLAQRVCDRLPGQVALIEQDWYYRDQRHLSFPERLATNYDHPGALETPLLLEHIRQLLAGTAVWAPRYNFSEHIREATPCPISPRPILILEGLHALGRPELRELMALKVFVDLEADLRLVRRLRRDLAERGRSLDGVFRQYLEQVRPMHEQWVAPTKAHADIVVSGAQDQGVDTVLEGIQRSLAARQGV